MGALHREGRGVFRDVAGGAFDEDFGRFHHATKEEPFGTRDRGEGWRVGLQSLRLREPETAPVVEGIRHRTDREIRFESQLRTRAEGW